MRDPRALMIVLMALLLGGGALLRDFSLRPEQVLLTFAAGIGAQLFFIRRLRLEGVGVLSAAVTCFGLSLLLRSDSLWAHPAAAALAVSAKFLLRVRGKHVFNPANLGVIAALSLLPGTWVSPGQWGADVAGAGWLLALGALTSRKAGRWDIAWAFLAFYMGALGLRMLWLGQTFAVWSHSLQNGALLLFAFFMITDPRTTPDSRAGRVLHALAVAVLAYGLAFGPRITHSFLWALFALSPLVPLWDALLPAPRHSWRQGDEHGTTPLADGGAALRSALRSS